MSAPSNYFPLAAEATKHLLIAGGIGITPLLSMARELLARGADFKLVYCARSPESAAFLPELATPEFAGRVLVHHDHGDPQRSLALAPLLAERTPGAHLYCCGPRSLMQAVRDAACAWPADAVHFENFGTSAHPAEAGGEQPFVVRLLRSGARYEVAPGVSILETLRRCGVDVPSSCESGTCGTCRTPLVSGTAEHRDFVLDEDEQQSEIMICVSRAAANELVLDL